MYDRATQSLWSTLWGKPVVGPLVGSDISLERLSVVTTTWGEWRRKHPESLVLSKDTGHVRNYSEGEAYRHYFATDDLMFPVQHKDNRLNNKQVVLALQMMGGPPVAVSTKYLIEHPIAEFDVGASRVVVITDTSGANRVYESAPVSFVSLAEDVVKDENGDSWAIGEAAIEHPDGRKLLRQPAHRAFWFGWRAAYPHTQLIK